jgi:repressor LexA
MFIHERLETSGSRIFEEMKGALDLKSKSGVHRLIGALEERGFLRRLPNRARALEVVKMPDGGSARSLSQNEAVNAKVANIADHRPAPAKTLPVAANDVINPLHGKIAAGVPIEAEGRIRLGANGTRLGLTCSKIRRLMVEAGILDGDYALIRKTQTARWRNRGGAGCGEEATLNISAAKMAASALIPRTAAMIRNIMMPRG